MPDDVIWLNEKRLVCCATQIKLALVFFCTLIIAPLFQELEAFTLYGQLSNDILLMACNIFRSRKVT